MRSQIKKMAKKVFPLAPLALFLMFIILVFSIVRVSIFGEVPQEKHVFFEISLLLLLAVLAELTVNYLKQPTVIILLLLGAAMSPSVIGIEIFKDQNIIEIFAQLGAIFLLFRVGLHSEVRKIFSKENMIVATLGVIVPFIAGIAYALYTGGNFIFSMFLGTALTATSVGVSVAILKEAKLLKEKFAEVLIGAAVIDDVLGLLVLSFVLSVPASYDFQQVMTQVPLELSSIVSSLASLKLPDPTSIPILDPIIKITAATVILIGGGILAGNWFVRNFMDKEKSLNGNLILIVVAFLLVYAYIAEYIGLSSIVGAFIAGLIISRSTHLHEIETQVYPIEAIFTPIFFISLGLLVDVNMIGEFLVPIIVISLIAIFTKLIGCGIGALASGISKLESAIIGFGMAPRGEVALIVALIGLTKGVLDSSEYAIIASMAIVTTLFPPLIMNYLIRKRNLGTKFHKLCPHCKLSNLQYNKKIKK